MRLNSYLKRSSKIYYKQDIESIRGSLKGNVFYNLSPRNDNLQEELSAIITLKAEIVKKAIGQALNKQ